MDKPSLPQQNPYVILPWAAQPALLVAQEDTAQSDEATDLRVSAEHLGVAERPAFARAEAPDQHSRTTELDPRLRALGLPVSPQPSIPSADRAAVATDETVALAVALDVLATMTRGLDAEPLILQRLTQVALSLGEQGGLDTNAKDELLAYADGELATERARLCRALGACLAAAAGGLGDDGHARGVVAVLEHAHASTPASVATSVRRLEAAATLIVRETSLMLQAGEAVDYWLV
jgi:hypothetical protein